VPADPAVETSRLHKRYGAVQALRGVDLRVETGSVFRLLGPNGAGKTTAVRILTTLLQPDEGSARVAGFDVVRDAAKVRRHIGLAGQYAAVDENLTGFENLEMVGRLYHLGRAPSRERARELLAASSAWAERAMGSPSRAAALQRFLPKAVGGNRSTERVCTSGQAVS
jgi:ABC-2 type transport system ATP-binding protein